ncbi:Putative ribonuclease H protein, partial [Glycine soja]
RGFNNTVVTLIPKGDNARYVKDYHPIVGCTIVYKIIAKIITERLGKILPSIISHSQAAFVPGQNIHNHILLAYELLNGYGRKGGTPRVMMQGDSKSVSMMMETIRKFSDSTGLKVNPAKCQMFFGGMDGCSKENLRRITDFAEGKLPVRYLGVPLSCKRLTIQQYMPLIDKIVDRVKHWTSKLLSYAGRIQLVKSITSAIAMYWMQCFPLPQFVLRKINAICRSFVWTGKQEISKKSLVA